jgi:acyl carrier protein
MPGLRIPDSFAPFLGLLLLAGHSARLTPWAAIFRPSGLPAEHDPHQAIEWNDGALAGYLAAMCFDTFLQAPLEEEAGKSEEAGGTACPTTQAGWILHGSGGLSDRLAPRLGWTRDVSPKYTVELTAEDRLQAAFRRGLALPKNFDARSVDAEHTRTWDSVGHLQLVVAIEDEFGIRLEPADIVELRSYQAAEAILKRRGRWADG